MGRVSRRISLIKISDSVGNSVNYRYNSEGNRLSEEIRDPQNVLHKSLSYQYDSLKRLSRVIGPDGTFSQYGYDNRGNRTSITDPNGHTTGYQYDGLNQMTAAIQPGEITTGLGYDSQGNLTSVSDGNGNTTSYRYDDMSRVYQVISPDTGTTTYTYDGAGNLTGKTDAMQLTTLYQYDAANRLTKIDYPSDTDIYFTYDNCQNGKGRLCSINDQSGISHYQYTLKGQLAKESKTILGVTYVTSYTRPSGLLVNRYSVVRPVVEMCSMVFPYLNWLCIS